MSNVDMTDVPLDSFSRILHPYNTVLITSSSKGKSNVMAAAWIMPVSIDPPILALSIKAERYSFKLIDESGFFAVNIPSFENKKQVLICGRKSGKDVDKFKLANFTTEPGRCIEVPVIKECVAHIECRVSNTYKLGDHILVVGEVCAAYAGKEVFDKMYKLDKHRPLLHLGGNKFTTTEKLTAKTKK
jgi:flavin reductase (DIM6/NTAB) family NADH-FMN oxidoreductase RutF